MPLISLVILLIFWVFVAVPVSVVVRKAGFSAWWNLMHLLPLLGSFILLWITAMRKWRVVRTVQPDVFD
ncbi:hypothetical protein [Pseudaestuariivita rosea]|uniref:hypothetical protein n=1 Tax=Pseudaestuariivita rosea TaxID=2763263 RepID=UPI001ABAB96C|nr:hypothetical protein [Pseudaestuariivita rosea]